MSRRRQGVAGTDPRNALFRHRAHTFRPLIGAVDRNVLTAILFVKQRTAKKGSTMTTRAHVRSVVSDAQDKGREAVEAVSEVRDNMSRAIDKSLKERPCSYPETGRKSRVLDLFSYVPIATILRRSK
jgi:hypothetical protein